MRRRKIHPQSLIYWLLFIVAVRLIFAGWRILRKSIWIVSVGNLRLNVWFLSTKPVLRKFALSLITSSDFKTKSPTRLDVLDDNNPAVLALIIVDAEERRCLGWLTERNVGDDLLSSAVEMWGGGDTGRNGMIDSTGWFGFDNRPAKISFNSSTGVVIVAGADFCRLTIWISFGVCLKNSGGGQSGACAILLTDGAVDGRSISFFVSSKLFFYFYTVIL